MKEPDNYKETDNFSILLGLFDWYSIKSNRNKVVLTHVLIKMSVWNTSV